MLFTDKVCVIYGYLRTNVRVIKITMNNYL